MNLSQRLKRIEQAVERESGSGNTIYVARRDKSRNTMTIRNLSFQGTIEEGETFIEQYNGGGIFVIMNIPDYQYRMEGEGNAKETY